MVSQLSYLSELVKQFVDVFWGLGFLKIVDCKENEVMHVDHDDLVALQVDR